MYRWLFHRIPGPTWVKAAAFAVAAAAFMWLMFDVVFPWVEPFFNERTVP